MPLSAVSADLHILHVEDDEDDAFMLEEALDSLPQRICLEHKMNGQDAIAWLDTQILAMRAAKSPVDLVILDLNMPIMNGLEFLERVRSDARYRGLNVVVMTTATNEDVLAGARAAGANDALSKTASVRELSEQCTSLIHRYGNAPAAPLLQF